MIDIHCHILPGIDDGPKNWHIAVEMCRLAQLDGIEHIIATPHANERYAYDRQYLLTLLEELRQRTGHSITFGLGCDFHLSYENLEDALTNPNRYTIENGPYLLVEFSNYGIPPQLSDRLFDLRAIGITPILTHPERNPILQREPQRVLNWIQQGCVVQITASSMTGFWGDKARRNSFWLLEHDAVHVLATDAHDARYRKPILSEVREIVIKSFGPDVADALVNENPRAIIAGQALPLSHSAAS